MNESLEATREAKTQYRLVTQKWVVENIEAALKTELSCTLNDINNNIFSQKSTKVVSSFGLKESCIRSINFTLHTMASP